MRIAVIISLLAAGAAGAAGAETRAPTAAEKKSFEQFYQQQAPGAPLPALAAERVRGAPQWTLSAYADQAPVHAVLPLCRVERRRFTHGADGWRAETEQHVWVQHQPQCGTPPATMVQLRAPLADIDVLKLVQAQAGLLQNARLLMSGNTSCAPVRARAFRLSALGRAKDGLQQLTYTSDIGTSLELSVRPARTEFSAWNVNCK